MQQVATEIKIGDYIKSDFYSPMQGFVKHIGVIGKNIPAYQIEIANGRTEYIIKGQAILLTTKEEREQRLNPWARHD